MLLAAAHFDRYDAFLFGQTHVNKYDAHYLTATDADVHHADSWIYHIYQRRYIAKNVSQCDGESVVALILLISLFAIFVSDSVIPDGINMELNCEIGVKTLTNGIK